MLKKKLLIIGGVVLGIIALFVILCFTLFGLRSVTVDFRTSTQMLTGLENEIVESGQFHLGGSVLFMGKKGATSRIEKAFPYAKVVNIETVFPSKYVVHIAERQEVYAIESGDQFYITDEEFKVLNIVSNLEEHEAICLSGFEVENAGAEEGDFLQISNGVDIYSSFLQNNRALHEQRSMIEKITVGEIEDVTEQVTFKALGITFKMRNGQTYIIKNCLQGLQYKIAKMLAVYSNIFDELLGKEIEGQDRVWSQELISQATIEINNKYSSSNESDTTYSVIPPQIV